jgi:polyisoprenoid-binding protein YceI
MGLPLYNPILTVNLATLSSLWSAKELNMIKMNLKNTILTLLTLLPAICIAAAPAWQIVPAKSSLTFTATQNDAPVTGKFQNFTGDIYFDPNQLSTSKVKIVVDVGSVTDAYHELSDTLKRPEWFNIKLFPQAIFEAKDLIKTGDKTYQAKGTLTIRDKTVPLTLTFTQEEYSQTTAQMKGSAIIKRSAFGVGQGEWADTKTIKDDVKIDFTIAAVKK